MNSGRHALVKELFLAAVALPAAQRDGALRGLCGGDLDLEREVAELLALDAVTGDDLLRGSIATPADDVVAGARLEGERAYRLLRAIGEGGMGRVFLAERADGEFRQEVAIKLLAWFLGADAEAARRFRSERQILARLNHPNVARLLDGGTTAKGQPYLVMEYVAGVPIDDFADQQGLSIDARIRLILKVCDVVSFAHRSLIVHRDLKPGNVLVTADGEPKLLDFGIAKLLDPEFACEAVETRRGEALLTPRYASPEQVRGDTITTASDVYSLGVILYELLTGVAPYAGRLRAPEALLRAICEQEPPPPSAANRRRRTFRHPRAAASGGPTQERTEPQPQLSVLGDALAPAARVAGKLGRDLDAIVLKALRKEPDRRYGSVEALADDLRRYLANLPVAARRGAHGYRLGKLLRRHGVAFAAAGLFAVVVSGFSISLKLELDETQRQRDTAEQVVSFLTSTFEAVDPATARGAEITAKELLDRGATRLEQELARQPVLLARLLGTIGTVQTNLGLYEDADRLLERALALQRALAPGGSLDLAHALVSLAEVRIQKSDFASAAPMLDEAIALETRLAGPADRGRGLSLALDDLATIASLRGDFTQAQSHYERARTIREADPRQRDGLATTLLNLCTCANRQGRGIEAERLCRRSLEIQRELNPGDHPSVATASGNLATTLHAQFRLDEARALYRESLAMRRRLHAPDHSTIATSLNNLAALEGWAGDFATAEPLYREALESWSRTLGADTLGTSYGYHNVGTVVLDQDRVTEALPLLARASRIRERELVSDDPDQALTRTTYGEALARSGRVSEGESLLRRGLATQEKILPASAAWRVALTRSRLAGILLASGRPEEARSLLALAVPVLRERLGDDHPWTRRATARQAAPPR